MFNQKLINVLIKILAWSTIVAFGLCVVYALWEAGGYWDFFEGVGFFLGFVAATGLYLSLFYIILSALYKCNNK